jgi:polyisoprenoid-binding protein YceI
VLLVCLSTIAPAQKQPLLLQFDPALTNAEISLSATLHTVHGKFQLKHGEFRFDPASGEISGEMVFDATTGKTGNDRRDNKMHKTVLESEKYPEIVFRPHRVEGQVAASGTSSVRVLGIFSLHGTNHEVTLPVEVRFQSGSWSATSRFPVPYVQWGLKNPSSAFLHVSDSVEVEFHAEGKIASAVPPA